MQKFIITQDEQTAGKVSIKGQDARHIAKVLRLKPGDNISMTNGCGTDFSGQIEQVRPEGVIVNILEKKLSATESNLHLALCSAMLKHNKMDEIIKHITQVGVTRWIPFYSTRSIPMPGKGKEEKQVQRWQTIAKESLKQCRRSCLVDIVPPVDFQTVLDISATYTNKYAFWEASQKPLMGPEQQTDNKSAIILIGPEGGFEAQEIELAQQAGFTNYSLGPRILRAETAAVCAAALIQFIIGDMGKGK